MTVYAYWPWQAKIGLEMRVKPPDKKAVTIIATACLAWPTPSPSSAGSGGHRGYSPISPGRRFVTHCPS